LPAEPKIPQHEKKQHKEEFRTMRKHPARFESARRGAATLLACVLPLACGLTAFAAHEAPNPPRTASPPAVVLSPPADEAEELYPADVQISEKEDGKREIVKTYVLTAEQNPRNIPRADFERDGFRYVLTDITENRTSVTDAKTHTETVRIETPGNGIDAILAQLAPTLKYESEDGRGGILALDPASVKCEAAGRRTESRAVTATREYPHLSNADTSLIPKTITENGGTLTLKDVTWEAQNTINEDYADLPDGYRAVAVYAGSASKSVVTGYVTTAEYTGEIAKTLVGETVYAACFEGVEISPEEPESKGTPGLPPAAVPPLIALAVLAALLGGFAAFFFLRRNVRVYATEDGRRELIAKARISAKNPRVDLTPLEGRSENGCFALEIDRPAAKSMSGKNVEIAYGPICLKHKIAYEGNPYLVEADFRAGTVRAVYRNRERI
jgi:hypothetical protein